MTYDELGKAASIMIEALAMSRRVRRPDATVGQVAHDFNRLLERSRSAHPGSGLVAQLRPLSTTASLVTLLTRVSLLKGALDAASGHDVSDMT